MDRYETHRLIHFTASALALDKRASTSTRTWDAFVNLGPLRDLATRTVIEALERCDTGVTSFCSGPRLG